MMVTCLTEWTVRVDVDAGLRGQGADPEIVRRRSPLLVERTEALLPEAGALLRPQVFYREFAVAGRRDGHILLDSGSLACGPRVTDCLGSAQVLVVVVCTVGPQLEDRVNEMIAKQPLDAVILDGIGNASVEALGNEAIRHFGDVGECGAESVGRGRSGLRRFR